MIADFKITEPARHSIYFESKKELKKFEELSASQLFSTTTSLHPKKALGDTACLNGVAEILNIKENRRLIALAPKFDLRCF